MREDSEHSACILFACIRKACLSAPLRVLTYVAAQQVIALIESLSSSTAQDASKQEADIQQALTTLASQQPVNLELHAKLAKAALQAGATAAAMQTATALTAAALPQGRAIQDVLDPADAPNVAAGDWQWLSVASLVMGQVHACSSAACFVLEAAHVQMSVAWAA